MRLIRKITHSDSWVLCAKMDDFMGKNPPLKIVPKCLGRGLNVFAENRYIIEDSVRSKFTSLFY